MPRKRATASASSVDSVLSARTPDATSGDVAGGHATIVLLQEPAPGVLVAHSLAPPGKGKTYQLWLIVSRWHQDRLGWDLLTRQQRQRPGDGSCRPAATPHRWASRSNRLAGRRSPPTSSPP